MTTKTQRLDAVESRRNPRAPLAGEPESLAFSDFVRGTLDPNLWQLGLGS
jgi:hypothetical protein